MPSHSWRVLLAEDDRVLRRAVELTLTRHGFAVLTAGDGEEALRLARTEWPDLILLDLLMPKLGGFDVLRALKDDAVLASIPVIVLSALAETSDRVVARALGASDYWLKSDLSLRDLAKSVKAAFDSCRTM